MNSTVVVRRIAATPARSAADAWQVIAELVAPRGSAARRELDQLAGIASALIAAEALRENPLVIHGAGPRLRMYCLYDDDAVLGEGVMEDVLPWCPTQGNWAMSLPCLAEDLEWMQAALARISTRVTIRDAAEAVSVSDAGEERSPLSTEGTIDKEAFLRP